MGKSKIWICEECGREYKKLPFPASCECGNFCEDFFREKDCHDYEDDKIGKPLLGVKYDTKVLAERNKRLNISQDIKMKIDKNEKPIEINSKTKKKFKLKIKPKKLKIKKKVKIRKKSK